MWRVYLVSALLACVVAAVTALATNRRMSSLLQFLDDLWWQILLVAFSAITFFAYYWLLPIPVRDYAPLYGFILLFGPILLYAIGWDLCHWYSVRKETMALKKRQFDNLPFLAPLDFLAPGLIDHWFGIIKVEPLATEVTLITPGLYDNRVDYEWDQLDNRQIPGVRYGIWGTIGLFLVWDNQKVEELKCPLEMVTSWKTARYLIMERHDYVDSVTHFLWDASRTPFTSTMRDEYRIFAIREGKGYILDFRPNPYHGPPVKSAHADCSPFS